MEKKLTLTFDNGPKPGVTEHILDVLGRYGIRTTFFLVGEHLRDPAARALAERAHAEGHWIGNHTMRHIVPLGLSDDPDHPQKEIAEADEIIGDLHHPDRFFRPPGRKGFGPHCLSRAAYDFCVRNGHTIVFATNIPRDGELPPEGWSARIFEATDTQDWAVTILHDKHQNNPTRDLPGFIEQALDRGITFVQDFPDSVLPMVRGQARHPLETFVIL